MMYTMDRGGPCRAQIGKLRFPTCMPNITIDYPIFAGASWMSPYWNNSRFSLIAAPTKALNKG